jgi:hypothetical protein
VPIDAQFEPENRKQKSLSKKTGGNLVKIAQFEELAERDFKEAKLETNEASGKARRGIVILPFGNAVQGE